MFKKKENSKLIVPQMLKKDMCYSIDQDVRRWMLYKIFAYVIFYYCDCLIIKF